MIKITKVTPKNNDWKLIDVVNEAGAVFTDVSVNRTDKKTNQPFPNFDTLAVDQQIDGTLWQNNAGKWYLFPPRPQTTQGGANRGQSGAYKAKMVEETMAKKQGYIQQSQENKEHSIRVASVNSAAVQCAIAEYNQNQTHELTFLIEKYRKYLWLTWNNYEKFDLPFVSNEKELTPDEEYDNYPAETPGEMPF